MQSRLKARGKVLLTATTAQNILKTTGAAQLRFSGGTEQAAPANWKGVTATFGRGIDAALWNGKSDKLYMFRGNQYLRIDPAANWSVEPEYPKPIAGNWPGFPTDFENGVDAAIWSDTNQKVYFFKGSEYIRVDPFNSWNVDSGYPKPIAGNWPGFPASFATGVDTAIWNGKNNKIYFFKGSEYIRVNPNNSWNVDPGYPKPISGNWPGLDSDFTSDMGAALWSGTNNKIYFFKGEDYVRVDPFNGWNQDAGYPKLIATNQIGKRPDLKEAFADLDIDSNWPGFPNGFGQDLDASVWADKNGKVYFFKGNEYLRINPDNNWEVDAGYPKPISGNWPGFPASFANGVDAAIWSGTTSKIYFFKDDEYIRVDPNNGWNVDPGYPKPIAGNWPNLAVPFTNGLDCALWNDKSNKLYLFTGSEYVRINPANGWKVDKYYPRPIIS